MKTLREGLAKPEDRERAVNRAKAMLERAKGVNKAQHAHGINSTSASIEWWIKGIESGQKGDYGGLNVLHDKVMQLGGYLYSLKEGLE